MAGFAGSTGGVTELAGRSVPDMTGREPLDEQVLRAALETRWSRVAVVGETGSTNADLLADTSAPDQSVLVAEVQTDGRGRLDRTWTSPRGAGLTFSVLLRPAVPMAHLGWLPLLAGVALHDAVTAETDVPVVLKWPNDLLAGDGERKVAGILAQARGESVVVGIGLNVTTTRDELPDQAPGGTEPTSLALEASPDVDREELLVAILGRLDARYAQWLDVKGDAEACGLAAAYRAACATLGREVVVATVGDTLTGTAVDIDAAGRLVLDVGGERQAVAAGDVEHVRSR